MKRILRVLLAAVMMTALVVSADAAESGLVMADVTVQGQETIYVPVSVQEEVKGTAMSLTYTYDRQVLEIIPEECKWIPKGALADFSRTGPQAVWAASGAKKISGDLCVLTFRLVKEGALTDTEVSCSVTVKNGSDTVGVYQASAGITKVCEHLFGDWTDIGLSGHVRKCSLCGKEMLQSHNWDTGTTSADSGKPNVSVMIYRCKDCAAEKALEIAGGNQEKPLYPEMAKPSAPTERDPEETRPQPYHPSEEEFSDSFEKDPRPTAPPSQGSGKPGGNSGQIQHQAPQSGTYQPKDYNQPQETAGNPEEREDGWMQSPENGDSGQMEDGPGSVTETRPMAIKVEKPAETPEEKEVSAKTTEAEASGADSGLSGILLAACAAAVLGILLLRKKKP